MFEYSFQLGSGQKAGVQNGRLTIRWKVNKPAGQIGLKDWAPTPDVRGYDQRSQLAWNPFGAVKMVLFYAPVGIYTTSTTYCLDIGGSSKGVSDATTETSKDPAGECAKKAYTSESPWSVWMKSRVRYWSRRWRYSARTWSLYPYTGHF